jgi:hypothetical protein
MSDFIMGLAVLTWALSPAIFLVCVLISCGWNWTVDFINDDVYPEFAAEWPEKVIDICESNIGMQALSTLTLIACLACVLLGLPLYLLEFDGTPYEFIVGTGGVFDWVAYPISVLLAYTAFIFSARAIVRLAKATKELKNKLQNHINDPNGHK